MRTRTVCSLISCGVCSFVACADKPTQSCFNGNVAFVTDYIFRGETQTNNNPALQASLEYDHASGLYAGGFLSNVNWLKDARPMGTHVTSQVETDFWLGFRHAIDPDWSYDAGLYYYYYPGQYPAHDYVRPHTLESSVQVAWRFLSFRYWYSFSDWFGDRHSVGAQYYDLSYSQEIAPSWTLQAHVGHQYVPGNRHVSFTDWRLGVSKAFAHGLTASLSYTQGNGARRAYTYRNGNYLEHGTVVFGVSKALSF